MDYPTSSKKAEFDDKRGNLSGGDIAGGPRAVLNATCEAIGIIPPSGEDEKDKGILPLLLEMEKRCGVGVKGREEKAILESQMEKLKQICEDEPPNRSLCLIVLVLSWCKEPAFLRNGCNRAINIIQKKESGLETLKSTRSELLYSFRHILPGGRCEKKIEYDSMLWTILDKFLAALTAPIQIADTKRTTSESDPVRDQWAAECELGLVHLAEKAAEMANEALLQSFGRNWSQEDRTNWTEQHRFCLPRAVHACCVVLPLRSAPKDAVTQLAVAALQLSREHWKREGRWDGGQDSASLIASALESCSSSYRLRMGVSEGCDDGDNFKAPAPEVQLSLISCWLQNNGPPLALVALARGVMSCCTSEESVLLVPLGQSPLRINHEKLRTTLPLPKEQGGLASSLLYGLLPSALLHRCSSPDPMLRHASLQVLQMWIHRAYQYFSLRVEASYHWLYKALITEAENVVIWNIDNPTRKASRLIIDSFEHLIRWRLGMDLPFKDIMRKITQLRNERKDKYVVLSLLLDVAGPSRTLSMVPYVVRQLLISIGNTANIGKSASSLLLRLLPHHKDWEYDVVNILVDADERLCQRILEFFLPTAIKQHVHYAPRLCKLIVENGHQSNSTTQHHLRLLLEVMTLARQSGAFSEFKIEATSTTNSIGATTMTAVSSITNAITVATPSLTSLTIGSITIENAYNSRDHRLRIAALSLLVAGFKRGSIPPPNEMDHLFEGLALCLKTSISKECSEVVRLFRHLALGLTNAARQSYRDDQQHGDEQRQQRLKDNCEHYTRKLCVMVLESIYPGTPFEREILGVQLVLALLECLCLPVHHVIICDKQQQKQSMKLETNSPLHEYALHEAAASILHTPHTVKLLMGLLMSTWDRTRHLAAELLENHMPAPLPGLEYPSSVARLMTYGIFASSNARSRDSDVGSLLVSLLFSVYVMKQGWLFESHETDGTGMLHEPPRGWSATKPERLMEDMLKEGVHYAADATVAAAARYFVLELCKVLENRIKSMTAARAALLEELPTQPEEFSSYQQRLPQASGVLVALKKCIGQVFLAHMDVTEWRNTVHEVYSNVSDAFDLALTVISAQNVSSELSNDDLNEETSCYRAQSYRSLGPVDSNHSIGAVNTTARSEFVTITQQQQKEQKQQRPIELDCRGHLLVKGSTPEEGSGVGGLHQQVVVGSWLMAKEAAFVLSDLVTKSISCAAAVSTSVMLLTEAQVEKVGHSFCNALLSMRHMGAISTVCNAFQKVCKALLQKCTIASLAALPLSWLRGLLKRLREEDYQFVLRRSSGFATAFQAILRSEPRDGQPVLLHEAMEELLSLAAAPRNRPSQSPVNDDRSPLGIEHKKGGWKARVHALNVLRMLIGDANMPTDILKFLTRSLTTALEGFEDGMWAVRNSCLMLFAAILRRVTVYPNSSPSSNSRLSSPRSLSFQSFNKFFPGLDFYLVDAIRLATSVPSNLITQASCPILFPILLLLAQIHSPGKAAAEEGTETENGGGIEESTPTESPPSRAEFISLIQCTASSPECTIREMGAKALASLMKDPDSYRFLISILDTMIPAEPPKRLANHNAIHGTLLQVLALLRKNTCTAASEPSFVNALVQRLWLTNPDICPCPTVRLAMHRVLGCISVDVLPLIGAIRLDSWKRNITFCLPQSQSMVEDNNGNKGTNSVNATTTPLLLPPGQPELWFECAKSWCYYSVSVLLNHHHFISAATDAALPDEETKSKSVDPAHIHAPVVQCETEMISNLSRMNCSNRAAATAHIENEEESCSYLHLFSSKMLEFRSGAASGALNALQEFNNGKDNSHYHVSDKREVQQQHKIYCEGIRKLCDVALVAALCENHPPTTMALTQVVCKASGQLLELSDMFINARLQISEFAEACLLHPQSAPSDALELMGHCVKGMLQRGGGRRLEHFPKKLLVNWVDMLMKASNPNTPAAIRRSASASLRAGYTTVVNFFSQSFSNDDGFIIARMYYVGLILLNDDEEDIRDRTADTVAGATNHPLVEKQAIRSVAEALGGLEGLAGLAMLFHVLREVSLGASDAVKRFVCHNTNCDDSSRSEETLPDAIFEDEEVNSHGEDVLLALEAARSLDLNFSRPMTAAASLIGRCGSALNDAVAILHECTKALRCLVAPHITMENDSSTELLKQAAANSCLISDPKMEEGFAVCRQMYYFTVFGCGYDCRVFPKLISVLVSAGVAVRLANGNISADGCGRDDSNAKVIEELKKSALEVVEAGKNVMDLVASGILPPLHPFMEMLLHFH